MPLTQIAISRQPHQVRHADPSGIAIMRIVRRQARPSGATIGKPRRHRLEQCEVLDPARWDGQQVELAQRLGQVAHPARAGSRRLPSPARRASPASALASGPPPMTDQLRIGNCRCRPNQRGEPETGAQRADAADDEITALALETCQRRRRACRAKRPSRSTPSSISSAPITAAAAGRTRRRTSRSYIGPRALARLHDGRSSGNFVAENALGDSTSSAADRRSAPDRQPATPCAMRV